MPEKRLWWSDEIDGILRDDLTAGAAYVTPAGGAVLSSVAPCGLARREDATVGFTTSLGFAGKLRHILRDPHVSLAYHAREHGYSTDPSFVLAQGVASVDLTPSKERLEVFIPQAERYIGEIKQGRAWRWLLHEYYYERVFVDIAVERLVAWPDLAATGAPEVHGAARPPAPEPQQPPANGTGPRVDVDRLAGQLAALPHRLLAYRGSDGYPNIVPVDLAGHDARGLRLVDAGGLLPPGGRRAGLLAHSYRTLLVGLSTRTMTGWLTVGDDGFALYAPHTAKGFTAPPYKRLLLVANGTLAKYGMWRARREGVLEELAGLTR